MKKHDCDNMVSVHFPKNEQSHASLIPIMYLILRLFGYNRRKLRNKNYSFVHEMHFTKVLDYLMKANLLSAVTLSFVQIRNL